MGLAVKALAADGISENFGHEHVPNLESVIFFGKVEMDFMRSHYGRNVFKSFQTLQKFGQKLPR